MIHMEKVEMTIAELLTAYKNGTLTAPLMLDNDQVSVWPDNEDATEAQFDMHPEDLLRGLLSLLSIPWENV